MAAAPIFDICTPLRGGTIEPWRKATASGRPYRPPLRENEKRGVGAAFMAARAAPLRRTHHRRPHPVGADAHIGPLGIDIKSAIADHTHRRGAHGASGTGYDFHRTGGRCTRSRRHVGMPPYAQRGRRNALHTEGKRTRDARPYAEWYCRTPARIGTRFVGLEKVYHIPGEMETFSLGTAKMGLTAGVGYGIMASPVKKGLFFLPFSFRGNSISLPGCGREAKLRRCRTCASKSL